MTRRTTLLVALFLVGIPTAGDLAAQAPLEQRGNEALRRQVERRFDPLPLRDGIALRPKSPIQGVRSIEITAGTIALDGVSVSGAELRSRIGDAADLVIQLSYLDAPAQRALFDPASSVPVAAPAVVEPLEPVEPESRRRSRSDRNDWGGNDRVRLGQSITIGADEVVDGDVAAIGGSAHVNGTVHGKVVAVGGNIELGPRAIVDGDVTVVGGFLRRADGSRIDGSVKEIGLGSFARDWAAPSSFLRWSSDGVGSTLAFVSTITRGAVVSLLAALVVLLAGPYVERVGRRAAAEPLKAGAVGFLAQLLFFPLLVITILALVVTLVGIPLLLVIPFALVGLAVLGLVGFTAVARQVGEHVVARLGWVNPGPYLTTLAGILTVLLPVLLARLALLAGGTGVSFLWHAVAFLGFCLEYVVWTVGFGAVALVRLGRGFSANSAQLSANA